MMHGHTYIKFRILFAGACVMFVGRTKFNIPERKLHIQCVCGYVCMYRVSHDLWTLLQEVIS